MKVSDLAAKEQSNVRAALSFLRFRFGGLAPLAKALRLKETTIGRVRQGKAVSASLTFRVARLAGVSIDDLLAGRFPAPGTCPHCGRCGPAEDADQVPGR
jgi:hypothetical protein